MDINKKLDRLVNKKQKLFLIFLLISSIFLSFFEMIGLGSIGVFVAILSDHQSLINQIPFTNIQNFFKSLKIENLIIISGILLCSIFLVKNSLIMTYNYFELLVRNNLIIHISKKIYSNYLYRDISFHNRKNPAELINMVSSVTNVCTQYLFTIILVVKEVVLVIFLIFGLFLINLKLSFYLFLSIFIVSAFLFLFIKNLLRKIGKQGVLYEEKILKSLNEGLGGIKITKILQNYDFFINELINFKSKRLKLDLIVKILGLLPKLFLEILAVICTSIATIVLIKSNLTFSQIIPTITMISLILVRMVPAFSNLNIGMQNIRHTSFHFDNISDELKINIKEQYQKNFKNKSDLKINEINNLTLKNISFSYHDKLILNNVDMELNKGQFVGIIGKTGSGKTTLIDIILGLLKPKSGKIILNNNYEIVNFSSLSKHIGYVPQEIYLSDNTILKNIAFGEQVENINLENIKKSVELSQLDNFIELQEKKINTEIGDRGVRISGGQKQRIGIARALYRNPKILIMDESTNSLDKITEEKFLQVVKNLSKDLIILFITHKNSSLSLCDKIYSLEEGKLIKQ